MISVPNLLLQLNGSKPAIIILFSILLVSCATTSRSGGDIPVVDPNLNSDVKDAPTYIPVDTIQWTWTLEEEDPPIMMDAKVASFGLEKIQQDYYQIALILPLRIEQIVPNLDVNNKKFADFYGGIKMAAQRIDDLSANVKVYYTNWDQSRIDEIIQDMSYDLPDVIIGPFQTELISKLAVFAKENRIPLISPWKSNNNITEENVFFLQMRPGIEHYYRSIVDHINYNFDRANVGIIQRPSGQDRSKTALLENINQEYSSVPEVQAYQKIEIEPDSLMDAETNVFDTLLNQGLEVFVIPHFSSRDESFIYSCLRKMYGEKNGRDFYIYTMPVVLNSDRIDINILKNLNIRTAEFRFPDPMNNEVKNFREAYTRQYGWLPTEFAYYGFDLMNFIAYGLKMHGKYFHYYMSEDPIDLMQMKIDIDLYYKEEEKDYPDFLVNSHLYIIEYKEDHFEINDIR